MTVGKQDTSRIQKAKTFCRLAVGLGIPAVYREYDTAHCLTPDQVKDSLDFFKGLK